MSNTLITVEKVSKKFCRSLKRSLWYGVKDLGHEIIGSSNGHQDLRKDEFWAVNDISFEVKRGETLGLIGCNGAGKTSLLRMLNGLIKPDKGLITVKGQVQALIALGAGFNPILTGRENIYVNAAVLGISKQEVDRRFDEIVEFSGIAEFIETPVQSYSTGMAVRLGFAVAVHMNPDILLVDEVLAVGDLAFQLKCHRKLAQYRQDGGTTIMVTHNLLAIRNMCTSALWLVRGEMRELGEVRSICDNYEAESLRDVGTKLGSGKRMEFDPSAVISKVEFMNKNGESTIRYRVGDSFLLRIHFHCTRIISSPVFVVSIYNDKGLNIISNYSNLDGCHLDSIGGTDYIEFAINKLGLNPGQYVCSVCFSEKEVSNTLDWHEKGYTFTVAGNATTNGLINPFPTWTMRC
jgi:lipopolysaccharide transport system ATP-binding protein